MKSMEQSSKEDQNRKNIGHGQKSIFKILDNHKDGRSS
jgi:hypothetical protein